MTLDTKKLAIPVIIMVRVLCLSFLLLSPSSSFAKKNSTFIVIDARVQAHQKISNILKQHLSNTTDLQIFHNQEISRKQIILAQPSLIITLGYRSAQVIPPSSIPTLYTLISEENSNNLHICQVSNCKQKGISTNSYSIYLDQPISRQLNLLSLLFPNTQKVGVLIADFSKKKLVSLKNEVAKRNISLKSQLVQSPSTLSSQLNMLIQNIDILFTLPDPLIHNKHTISNLLLTTYRHNIPVIGFSKSYVNAGAIAAIYSSHAQIAQHISELASSILLSAKHITNTPFSPKYFSIAINKSVARSLDLHLPDEHLLKSQLLAIEK